MKFHILVLLARRQRRDLLGFEVSGSRVAVSRERYSILQLAVLTHCCMIDGSAPSVNSLQIGHSRSPKYWSVTGAFGLPSVLPLWGMPPSRELTTARPFFRRLAGGARLAAAAGRRDEDHDDRRPQRPATMPSWVRRACELPPPPRPPPAPCVERAPARGAACASGPPGRPLRGAHSGMFYSFSLNGA